MDRINNNTGYDNTIVMYDGHMVSRAEVQHILDSDRLIVYEVVRLCQGRPVFWHEHYERFINSLASIGKKPELSEEEFFSGIMKTAEECGITDNNLRIEQYRIPDSEDEHTLIYPIHSEYPTAAMFQGGVEAGLLTAERRNPQAKIFNKEMRREADLMIANTDAAEVLLVNRNNEITEGSRSNVFFILGGTVIAPPQHESLPGITRMKVLDIIRENGISYKEMPVSADSLDTYDAAFLTGTSKDVLPIASIRGEIFYDTDNPVLRTIMQEYSKRKSAA